MLPINTESRQRVAGNETEKIAPREIIDKTEKIAPQGNHCYSGDIPTLEYLVHPFKASASFQGTTTVDTSFYVCPGASMTLLSWRLPRDSTRDEEMMNLAVKKTMIAAAVGRRMMNLPVKKTIAAEVG